MRHTCATAQVQRVPAAAEKLEGLPIKDTNRKESDPPDEVLVLAILCLCRPLAWCRVLRSCFTAYSTYFWQEKAYRNFLRVIPRPKARIHATL